MWNFFKKNKKNKMVAELQILKEELQKFKYYQWLKTERIGNVTEFKDIVADGEMLFVEFADGSRINAELLDEYLLRTNMENELLEQTAIAPQPVAQDITAKVRISDKKEETPLHALLKKQKPNPVNVDISIELNIPGPELYKVICSSFDGAEEEVAEWVVQGINMDTIKNIIKEGLKKYYA